MKSRDFVYWLQGFFELQNPEVINKERTEMIKNHLSLVFKHEIDPSMGGPEHQKELNDTHNKPTLSELGDKYGFEVMENQDSVHGPQPYPGWVCGIHGWYDPKEGTPRC